MTADILRETAGDIKEAHMQPEAFKRQAINAVCQQNMEETKSKQIY